MGMEAKRKLWNEHHKDLREALKKSTDHSKSIELFLSQHALLHSAEISQSKNETFADEVWQGLTDTQIRTIPPNFEHSIAWNFWHMARIEDVVLSLLVANSPQVFLTGNWLSQLNISRVDTGNNMSDTDMRQLSNSINIQAIWLYCNAVGKRTREVIGTLQSSDLKQKVKPAHIQRIWDEKALVPAAYEIADYWARRKVRELLLMPFTRHNFLHLNEARRIRVEQNMP